ncbi:MAG: HEPN domain-containing protein, partial [Candidatus Micrarchaeota archaeon]
MNLSDLLKNNLIRKCEPDEAQARECLAAARRDVSVARKLLGEDNDWAFSIAYNAMLQSVRALMFFDGYAASGENRHKTAVDYADAKLGAKLSDKIELFERMRRKRHQAVYDKAGAISDFEAKHAVQTAEEFLEKI